MTTSNFVVTDSTIEAAGAISYWRLNASVDLGVLTAAWLKAGLPKAALPEEPSPKVGLSRALRDLETSTRKAVKIRGGNFEGGWGLVEIDTDDGNVRTRQVLRARKIATDVGVDVVVDAGFIWQEAELSDQINRGYVRARSQLSAVDLSIWLRTLAGSIHATSLRDSGGIYFIPRDSVPYWEKVVAIVSEVSKESCKIFRIPALKTAEAVEAILDSIEVEANTTIAEFEHDLIASTQVDGPGLRALRTRKTQAEKLADKLGRYEGLLGVKLDKIRERLETVSAGLVAAQFAAAAQNNAAA